MNEGKFMTLWTKYLPAIRILLKKAVNEKQQFIVSKMELQSIDNRKNVSFSFDMNIANGRLENRLGTAVIGKDLFEVLNSDYLVRNFIADKKISLQMSKSFVMNIEVLSTVEKTATEEVVTES